MINAVTEHRLYELPSCLFLWKTLGVPSACFPAPHFFNSVKLQVLYAWESVLAGCQTGTLHHSLHKSLYYNTTLLTIFPSFTSSTSGFKLILTEDPDVNNASSSMEAEIWICAILFQMNCNIQTNITDSLRNEYHNSGLTNNNGTLLRYEKTHYFGQNI